MIPRLGAHNVNNMPVAEVAIMTVFNQRKLRHVQMNNQK